METRAAFFVVALSLMVALALGAAPNPPILTVDPDPATVDAGITIVFTCEKGTGGDAPTGWEWYIDADKQTSASDTFKYVALKADNGKNVTCKGTIGTDISSASDKKALTITAVPAPTLTSSIAEAGGEVTVDNGFPVNFTCTKAKAAKQDAVSFKFYKGAEEITTSTTGASIAEGPPAVLTVTASSDWEGKVIKCNHFNAAAAGSYADSTKTFTLAVTSGASSQLVSVTTMALVLVLGAFFKE